MQQIYKVNKTMRLLSLTHIAEGVQSYSQSSNLFFFFKIPEDIMFDDLSDELAILGTRMVCEIQCWKCKIPLRFF